MTDFPITRKKIVFSGGGTLGPVTPLLILAEKLQARYELFFVGTSSGPEKEIVAKIPYLKFKAIASGKLRRYFSLANFFDFFKIIHGFFQSWRFLGKERPQLIVSAGGFVSVPLAYAAYLRKIPILIHQQDVRPGLANRLIAPLAQVVTTTFEKSLADYGTKAVWVGNPVKELPSDVSQAIAQAFCLQADRPFLFILGGGTGSSSLNRLTLASAEELSSWCQIIHLTGKNKQLGQSMGPNYQSYEFLDHEKVMALLERAELVVSRAGLATISELSALGKASLLIPLPDSHQEDNANFLAQQEAALVLAEKNLKPENFVEAVKAILLDQKMRSHLSTQIKKIIKPGAKESFLMIIMSLVDHEKTKL